MIHARDNFRRFLDASGSLPDSHLVGGEIELGVLRELRFIAEQQSLAQKLSLATNWQSKSFTHEAYDTILKTTIAEIEKLGTFKGGEYAGDGDRLANFRRNAINLGLLPEQVWAVYAGKHWDAVMQYIKDLGTDKDRKRLESIEGRMDDLLVYLILAKCMLKEREQG